jgi:hypothetical protein
MEDGGSHLLFADFTAAYDLSSSTRLTGSIGFIGGDFGDSTGEGIEATTYSIAISQDFGNGFAGYAEIDGFSNASEEFSSEATNLTLGVTYRFGGGASGHPTMPEIDFRDLAWLTLDNW